MIMMYGMPIIVREVWRTNLEYELMLIRSCFAQFHIASMDTEYPGTVVDTSHIPKYVFSTLSPSQEYSLMKPNVDRLNLIQLGITLSDADGNLPTFGTPCQYVWQFNFGNFDPERDPHNANSISMLKAHGTDFCKNREWGIDSKIFGLKFVEYGLWHGATWVTFHGIYDYGHMIKILTGRALPENYEDFVNEICRYFGRVRYDVKVMAKELHLHGSLEKIAEKLNMGRGVGTTHQAGPDSMLTMQVFHRLIKAQRPTSSAASSSSSMTT